MDKLPFHLYKDVCHAWPWSYRIFFFLNSGILPSVSSRLTPQKTKYDFFSQLLPSIRSSSFLSGDASATPHCAAVSDQGYCWRKKWITEIAPNRLLSILPSSYRLLLYLADAWEQSHGSHQELNRLHKAKVSFRKRKHIWVDYSINQPYIKTRRPDSYSSENWALTSLGLRWKYSFWPIPPLHLSFNRLVPSALFSSPQRTSLLLSFTQSNPLGPIQFDVPVVSKTLHFK